MGGDGRWWQFGGTGDVWARCFPAPDFSFATLLVQRRDLEVILGTAGNLVIANNCGERMLLYFRTLAPTLPPTDTFTARFPGQPEPALLFGGIDSVELQVPSHGIDVIAPRLPLPTARSLAGLCHSPN